MQVWIDLDNSPHVHFFAPIVKKLNERGIESVITVRSFAQTVELARWYGMKFEIVGEHRTPRAKVARVSATFWRAAQLARQVHAKHPVAALSHGSRALLLAAWWLRIPAMTFYDYEFVSSFVFSKFSHRVLVPDVIPLERLKDQGVDLTRLVRYPGLKEEVYVYGFQPDRRILAQLQLDPDRVILTMRPPATWAHYHNPESEILFRALVQHLKKQPDAQVVVLARTHEQADQLRLEYGITGEPFRTPADAVDALSLMSYSDCVFSGGGTMAREAALLGAMAYSTFAGRLGAADQALARTGKLKLLRKASEIGRLVFEKRNGNGARLEHPERTREFIIGQIFNFLHLPSS